MGIGIALFYDQINIGTTLQYPTTHNMYPVFADTGYGSCILS